MTSAYTLTVIHKGNPSPTEIATADRAPEVIDKIEALTAKYPDLHRIIIASPTAHLFSVDQSGQRVAD